MAETADTPTPTLQPAAAQPAQAPGARTVRDVEIGIVLSDVRQKTITVEIKRLVKHARYGKYLHRSTHLHVHDEKNEAKKGDRVEVVETRPISKQKRWRLVRIVEHAAVLGQLDIKEVEVPVKKAEPVVAADGQVGGQPPAAASAVES
jgi:small subunit ribosomal protein S17